MVQKYKIYSCIVNQTWVSYMRGKFANHLHHTVPLIFIPKCQCTYIYNIHAIPLQSKILHIFDLIFCMIFKHLQLIENILYFHLRYLSIKQQAYNKLWIEEPTCGTYIAPKDLLTPDTERSPSQCGRVDFFTVNIISTTTLLREK